MTSPALPIVSIGGLLALLVAATVFAGPLQRHMTATADQLFSPEPYISIVLQTPGKKIEYGAHGEDDGDDHGDAGDADHDDGHAGEDTDATHSGGTVSGEDH